MWGGKRREIGPLISWGPFVSLKSGFCCIFCSILIVPMRLLKTIFCFIFASWETQLSSCGKEGELRKEEGWEEDACKTCFTPQCSLICLAITSVNFPKSSLISKGSVRDFFLSLSQGMSFS